MNLEKLRRPLTQVEIEELRHALKAAKDRAHIRPPQRFRYLDEAMTIYRARRQRAESFGRVAEMFQEPAWDMLLDLYAGSALGQRLSVTAVLTAACVPATTALRQLRAMESSNLVIRRQDPLDRRRSFVTLTDDAIAMLNCWFERLALIRCIADRCGNHRSQRFFSAEAR